MKILVVDTMHPSLLPMLETRGWEFEYVPGIQREEIITKIENFDGLIIRSKTELDQEILNKAIKLKFIARAGAGIEKVDINETYKRNIQIFNAPEGNRDAVAEHAIGMLLALFNKIITADDEVRHKIWQREENRGLEIKGKTIGIIGYGNMGRAFAQRLSSFECEVLAYDKYLKSFSDKYAREVDREEIFEKADILSLHVPLTIESKGMVNKVFLNSFNKNIYVINTARGEILLLSDLLEAIESGKVAGACLDVLENEKLKNLSIKEEEILNKLLKKENIIFSPHIAGWTHESYVRINEVLVGKIEGWWKGYV